MIFQMLTDLLSALAIIAVILGVGVIIAAVAVAVIMKVVCEHL